ncbi:MAG: ubiquinone-binding protein [Rickettsia endosymbiont of Oxypoda opaca]|nr:ubiquinone-binding protein [Rickettsia endosymbiont of Oxypoda opaca]
MPSFSQVKILPYSPAELFYLVLDIEAYPKFLPWCAAAKIISKNNEQIIAELVLQVKGFSEKYQSSITCKILDGERYLINVEAISGPFKYLKNIWQFSPDVKGSLVEFNIDFKMQSSILDKLIGGYFVKATEKMINAFEKRAGEILPSDHTLP